eukprot:CAMPEP_0202345080 /NCGR_PEP_ID=MMETSP1126-20121109/4471_1 /ASSEMBLY_ACC=CAM_ASM_000457 /TAXON_ID=3047 /ORGANISM="Dunaliella tertiolecta, Strain CCMP1320" /LENGTH=132 /DNA_ID=CAMNT_0048936331 /DNA_START=272 /DNA_END=666 /DNA_ORIENTATION=+
MSTQVRHQQDAVLCGLRAESLLQRHMLVRQGGRVVVWVLRHHNTHIWVALQRLADNTIVLHGSEAASRIDKASSQPLPVLSALQEGAAAAELQAADTATGSSLEQVSILGARSSAGLCGGRWSMVHPAALCR